ncbi:MAG: protein kinase [Deltaproteobacteria bacterium]|nr:protein kinase [Deltaproteobacteria bacterium]
MAHFDDAHAQTRRIGRYEVLGEIASGGMATVFLAKSMGAKGFSRLVAIKRLHPHLEGEEEFVQMFLDEARLAARIRHPHVVATLDVEDAEGLYIVMEYIEGVTLLTLSRTAQKLGEKIPVPVAARIALDILGGLQAAHDLIDDNGEFLNLVHRDVSPQNILLGTDGAARLTDFGIAKAGSRLTQTRDGQLKGKISYMAPEQTRRQEIDRRVDLFAMGIVVWELLAGRRLFHGDSDVEVLNHLLFEPIPRLRDAAPSVPASLEQVVMKALERDPNNRYSSAHEFADAIERATKVLGGPGNHRTVASYLQKICGERIQRERGRIANGLPPTAESASTGSFKALDIPHEPMQQQPARAPTPSPAMPPPGQRFRAPTMAGIAPQPQPQPQPQRPATAPAPRATHAAPTKLPLRAAATTPAPAPRAQRATVMGMGPMGRAPAAAAPVALTYEQDFDEEMATMAVPSPHESWGHGEPAQTAPEFDQPSADSTIVESAPIEAIMERLRLNGGQPIAPAPEPDGDFEDDIEEIAPEPSGEMAPPQRSVSGPSPMQPMGVAPQRYPSGPSPMQGPAPTPSFAPLPPVQGSGPMGQYVAPSSPFGPLSGPQQPWSLGAPPQSALPTGTYPAQPGNERRSNVMAFALGMVIVAIFGGAAIAWTLRNHQTSTPAVIAPPARPAAVAPAPAPAPVAAPVAAPVRAPVRAPVAAPVPAPAPVAAPVPAPVPPPVAAPVPAPAPTPAPAAAPQEEPAGRSHRRRRSRRGEQSLADQLAPMAVPAALEAPPTRVLPTPAAPDPDAPDLGNPYRR